MSIQVAQTIMAICMIVLTLSIVVAAIALTMLALRLRKSVDTMTNKVQPLITQATETVKTANGVAQTLKVGAQDIIHKTEDTVESVTRRVKVTSGMIQESINAPVITVASVLTGVQRGLEALSQIRRRGGDGHAYRES